MIHPSAQAYVQKPPSFTLVFGASLILSISNRIATAAELNNQVFALVENSSQVTFSDLYAEYGEDAIYNFVFPGGIRGGYNRPPSQELYDHHWKGTVEMLIGKEQGNRELAESLPVDERQNALDAAKESNGRTRSANRARRHRLLESPRLSTPSG